MPEDRLADAAGLDPAAAIARVRSVLAQLEELEPRLELLELSENAAHPGDRRGGIEAGSVREAVLRHAHRPARAARRPECRSPKPPLRRLHTAWQDARPRRWRPPEACRHSRSPTRPGAGCCVPAEPCARRTRWWNAPGSPRRAHRDAPVPLARFRS